MTSSEFRRSAALFLVLSFVAGCASGPNARPGEGGAPAGSPSSGRRMEGCWAMDERTYTSSPYETLELPFPAEAPEPRDRDEMHALCMSLCWRPGYERVDPDDPRRVHREIWAVQTCQRIGTERRVRCERAWMRYDETIQECRHPPGLGIPD